MEVLFIFSVIFLCSISAYTEVLGLFPHPSPWIYLLKTENTFTRWHGCSDAHLHHTATSVGDKCVSSAPHKLKWKRFIIWTEAKQFKNPTHKLHEYLLCSCGSKFHRQSCVKLAAFLSFVSGAGVSGQNLQTPDFWDARTWLFWSTKPL